MAENIYILTASSGSYDTYEEHVIKAFFTVEGAEKAKAAREKNDELYNAWIPKIQAKIHEHRRRPDLQPPKSPIWPVQPKRPIDRKLMTEEQRQEYDRAMNKWTKEYDELQAKHLAEVDAYTAKEKEIFAQLWVDMKLPAEIVAYFGESAPYYLQKVEQTYSIEPLEIE